MAYNVVCNISGQVINEGNLCRAIPLVRVDSFSPVTIEHRGKTLSVFGASDDCVHPSSYWSPVGVDIAQGRYDEYGGLHVGSFEKDEATDAQWLTRLDMLRTLVATMPTVIEGENKSHDIGFNPDKYYTEQTPDLPSFDGSKDPLTDAIKEQIAVLWKAVWMLGHEDRLFTKDINGRFVPVKFALIHEAAYQGLLRLAQSQPRRGTSDKTNEAQAILDDLIDHVSQKPSEHELSRMIDNMLRRVSGVSADHHRYMLIDKVIEQYSQDGDRNAFKDALRPAVESALMFAALDMMRQSFTPIRYAGDDFSNEAGEHFARFVAETRSIVDRTQHEQMWGPYGNFALPIQEREDALTLIAQLVNEWDCDAQVISVDNDHDSGQYTLHLEATMAQEHFDRFAQYVQDEFYADSKTSQTNRDKP